MRQNEQNSPNKDMWKITIQYKINKHIDYKRFVEYLAKSSHKAGAIQIHDVCK